MAQGLEIELKLAASPAMLLQLRDHPLLAGKDRPLTLVTRYFDTPDGALHHNGAALRLRDGSGPAEQTFKSKVQGDGSLARGEWNAPATGTVPDPAAFPEEARATLERLLGGAAVQPLALTRIERTTRRITFGRSSIEAAFDFGTVEAGHRSEPISELELELIEGDPADLFALALQLPLGPELGWSTDSKGERGHVLALALPFSAARSRDVALAAGMDVAQGFRVIAWNCLTQLLGNYREVIASGHPDAVHQSRVAIRRLRAAFSLFRGAVSDAQTAALRAEWKAAAAALGPARDLHVLIERIEAAAAERDADETDELLHRLRGRRAAATRDAQAALAGTAFQHLLIGFAAWLERDLPRAEAPLDHFAATLLGRRRRKLARAGRLHKLSDDELHELRIKGKKLRYANEFFAALFAGAERPPRRFAKALGKLQDSLGGVHDLAVAHDQREALFADLDPIDAAGLSAQLAELLDTHGPTRRDLIRTAKKALARVAEAPAWWQRPDSERKSTISTPPD